MNKYGAKRTKIDGYLFHSKKEADHYLTLKILQRTGKITDLELQPVYPIVIAGKRICKVILDFRYKEVPSHELVIVDVKGHDTAMSKLKRKMVEAAYSIKVQLV